VDLANIFRTLPGPGEFSELALPLVPLSKNLWIYMNHVTHPGWGRVVECPLMPSHCGYATCEYELVTFSDAV